MLSNKEIICPESLLKIAKTKGPVKVVVVNAGKSVSIESTKQAVDEDLMIENSIIAKNLWSLNKVSVDFLNEFNGLDV